MNLKVLINSIKRRIKNRNVVQDSVRRTTDEWSNILNNAIQLAVRA
jgi:hypothetical protein